MKCRGRDEEKKHSRMRSSTVQSNCKEIIRLKVCLLEQFICDSMVLIASGSYSLELMHTHTQNPTNCICALSITHFLEISIKLWYGTTERQCHSHIITREREYFSVEYTSIAFTLCFVHCKMRNFCCCQSSNKSNGAEEMLQLNHHMHRFYSEIHTRIARLHINLLYVWVQMGECVHVCVCACVFVC